MYILLHICWKNRRKSRDIDAPSRRWRAAACKMPLHRRRALMAMFMQRIGIVGNLCVRAGASSVSGALSTEVRYVIERIAGIAIIAR